jgi:hypothetical protein
MKIKINIGNWRNDDRKTQVCRIKGEEEEENVGDVACYIYHCSEGSKTLPAHPSDKGRLATW